MCKALGHPARFSILRQLLREDRCICGRIVEVLPLAQSTVSQHLKVLKEAGLISGEVEGPRTCYCADREQLAALATALLVPAARTADGGNMKSAPQQTAGLQPSARNPDGRAAGAAGRQRRYRRLLRPQSRAPVRGP